MVDAGGHTRALKRAVLVLLPQHAPVLQQDFAVPLAGLDPAQAGGGCLPQREQDVRMVVARIVAFLKDGFVDGDIGDHAAADEDLTDES